MGDDELTDFLEVYAEVCADAGIAPLQVAELTVLARAMLTGMVGAGAALH